MEAALITATAAGLGSMVGAAASITTTWITQRTQVMRSMAEWRQRERETLFKEFINEASCLAIHAVTHSMQQPDAIMKLYVLLSCIRLVSGPDVVRHGEACCRALDSELKAAADVQRWLLPSLPALDHIGIAASYRTARYSSGDYYDVGRLPDGGVGVLIADVSGKGAAAAVLMAVFRSIVHDEVDRAGSTGPAALPAYADGRLRALGIAERGAFVTAFCGILDPTTGELVYSCAGHNPPRLLHVRDRSAISLDGAKTFPLGLFDDPHAHTEEMAVLMPGDLLLFYTDGITEARSPAGEFFRVDRLDQLLCNLPDPITADAAVQRIADAVARFAPAGAPADDQTVVALGGGAGTSRGACHRNHER